MIEPLYIEGEECVIMIRVVFGVCVCSGTTNDNSFDFKLGNCM